MDALSLKNVCDVFGARVPESVSGLLWAVISALWSWYGALIILFVLGWVFYEIKTRNGTAHYNSKNGFSPALNRFVGSGTYLGLQGLVYLLLTLIFGDLAYCIPWSYALHLIVFLFTGKLLNTIGFWPEMRTGKRRRR